MRSLILFIFIATGAAAEGWNVRTGDTPLDRQAVVAMLEGRTLTFFDNGQSKFSVGGAYSYTYANGGGTAYGAFEVQPDGTVCIAFRNGFGRCDRYVRNNGRFVMLTEKGERFPIRP
ncbi:MAG: hypothetical protein AB3N17_18060 [Tateyamaria sp.]